MLFLKLKLDLYSQLQRVCRSGRAVYPRLGSVSSSLDYTIIKEPEKPSIAWVTC